MFDPDVVTPVVDLLAELAGGGPALEFGIGRGYTQSRAGWQRKPFTSLSQGHVSVYEKP